MDKAELSAGEDAAEICAPPEQGDYDRGGLISRITGVPPVPKPGRNRKALSSQRARKGNNWNIDLAKWDAILIDFFVIFAVVPVFDGTGETRETPVIHQTQTAQMPRSNIVIRPATKSDLPAAIALENATFTSHAISPRQMRYLQQNPNAIFLVAKSGGVLAGDVVALIRRSPSGKLSGRIYSLVVDANFRGQRIGQKLMRAIMKSLAQKGVTRTYLEVEDSNGGAIHLYEQLGFQIIKPLRHYYGRGKHGVHMCYEAV